MADSPMQLDTIKTEAAKRFAKQGWPSPKTEAWKFTDLTALSKRKFKPASKAKAPKPKSLVGKVRIFFHNGIFQEELSCGLDKGVSITPLSEVADLLASEALKNHPVADQTLANMNGLALSIEGTIKEPIHLIFSNDGDEISSHPLLVVDIAKGAKVTLLEHHQGEGKGLSMPLMVVRINQNAEVKHGRIQSENLTRHHLAQAVFTLANGADYQGVSVQVGSALSRVENYFTLTGKNANAHLTTICLAKNEQVMDTTAFVGHEAPDCTSMQVVRGVLDDKAKGICQGKVRVAPKAQKTDGNQMSRMLLLSRKCQVDNKPELEIYADDVACSHGATIGEIDEGQLFYLLSRGIPYQEARQILIAAFLADALEEISDEVMRDFAAEPVNAWLESKAS